MNITYDKIADAIYITLKKGIVARTSKLENNITIDTDKNGSPLGIEILNASIQLANKRPVDITLQIPALVR